MGLKEILEALEQEASNAIKEIELRALNQAQQIREESVKKAERAKEEILASEKKKIEQECKNLIYAAEAERRRIISKSREEVFSMVRRKIEELIAADHDLKKRLYETALEDAFQAFGEESGELQVVASEADKGVIEEILKTTNRKLEVNTADGIDAGFALKTPDEKVFFVLTPQVVAERLMKLYISEISEKLFEENGKA